MATKPLQITDVTPRDNLAQTISHMWFQYNTQRFEVISKWKELRNFLFATDTTTTSNQKLPWKNKTTLPKLCQIRDNLHSNYISALFPNDDWLRWEAYTRDSSAKEKVDVIQSYMSNKTREGHFRTEISKLLYDYIDYGNAFATVKYVNSFIENEAGEKTPDYIGPILCRISPMDIVFNPLSTSFRESFKIVRSLHPLGELKRMAEDEPDNAFLARAFEQRSKLKAHMSMYGIEEPDKSEGYMVDGFGNYQEYLMGEFVEILRFYGDIYDTETDTLRRGREIVVIDRMWVIEDKAIPSWLGHAPIYHVGWRLRPDNLWSMGPLENLVGMQYRIDHLENLKADAMDLSVMPPLKIKGEVEQFEWAPLAEIHIDENGDVEELGKNTQWVIAADNAIDRLEMRMEQYAGAPKEAMGIRTPGEKTKYEVQELATAAGRIFQEKVTHFEVELLEKVLNGMLELAKRNLDRADIVRVIDNDIGAIKFATITKDDITASGKLRPIGARHFASQAQLVQNLTGLANTPIWQMVQPHLKTTQMAMLIEDLFGLSRYQLFGPNAGVFEQQETQSLINQAGEDMAVQASLPAA